MTLADRIKARMAQLNLSQAEVARRVGVAQPTIAKLVAGSSRSSSHLHRIARALETTPAYLAGETEDPAEGALPLPTLENIIEAFGQVLVPLVDMEEGHPADAQGNPRYVPYRREQLEPLISGKFSYLFACEVEGDAMLPTLRNGDILLIDRGSRGIRAQDRLWAVQYAGLAMVRRVRRQADGRLILMSDNPVVSDMLVAEDDIVILGEVIWRSGVL